MLTDKAVRAAAAKDKAYTGIANEEKQWAAITEQAEAKYKSELQAAEARINQAMRGQRSDNVQAVVRAELSGQLFSAALLRRNAFLLDQEIARAGSRARMVYERNLKLLRASEEKPEKANAKKVAEHRSLVGQAAQYLTMLDQRLTDVQTLPTRWRAMAARCEDNVQTMLKRMSRVEDIKVAPIRTVKATELQEPTRSSAPHPLPSLHQPFGQRPAIALSEEESSGIADIRRKIAQIKEEVQNEKKASGPGRSPQPQRNPPKPPIMQRPPEFPPPGFDRGW